MTNSSSTTTTTTTPTEPRFSKADYLRIQLRQAWQQHKSNDLWGIESDPTPYEYVVAPEGVMVSYSSFNRNATPYPFKPILEYYKDNPRVLQLSLRDMTNTNNANSLTAALHAINPVNVGVTQPFDIYTVYVDMLPWIKLLTRCAVPNIYPCLEFAYGAPDRYGNAPSLARWAPTDDPEDNYIPNWRNIDTLSTPPNRNGDFTEDAWRKISALRDQGFNVLRDGYYGNSRSYVTAVRALSGRIAMNLKAMVNVIAGTYMISTLTKVKSLRTYTNGANYTSAHSYAVFGDLLSTVTWGEPISYFNVKLAIPNIDALLGQIGFNSTEIPKVPSFRNLCDFVANTADLSILRSVIDTEISMGNLNLSSRDKDAYVKETALGLIGTYLATVGIAENLYKHLFGQMRLISQLNSMDRLSVADIKNLMHHSVYPTAVFGTESFDADTERLLINSGAISTRLNLGSAEIDNINISADDAKLCVAIHNSYPDYTSLGRSLVQNVYSHNGTMYRYAAEVVPVLEDIDHRGFHSYNSRDSIEYAIMDFAFRNYSGTTPLAMSIKGITWYALLHKLSINHMHTRGMTSGYTSCIYTFGKDFTSRESVGEFNRWKVF